MEVPTTGMAEGEGSDARPARVRADFRVYLITDRRLFGSEEAFFKALEDALEGGIRCIQLREKDLAVRDLLRMAERARELTRRYGAKLLINERADVALAVEADGVQLGSSGIPAEAARKAAGAQMIIGVSTHGVDEAVGAGSSGADFITLGPVYATPSKAAYGDPLGPGVLTTVSGRVSLPVYAIGGIQQDRVEEVLAAGAYGVALISGILGSTDIQQATRQFMRLTQ